MSFSCLSLFTRLVSSPGKVTVFLCHSKENILLLLFNALSFRLVSLLAGSGSIPIQKTYAFSYIGDISRGQKYLQIRNMSLDLQGKYECQVPPNPNLLRIATEVIVLGKISIFEYFSLFWETERSYLLFKHLNVLFVKLMKSVHTVKFLFHDKCLLCFLSTDILRISNLRQYRISWKN